MVTLTSFAVSNLVQLPAPLAYLKELHLSYNQNFITVSFAAMQFDFPDKIQYRYQLKGFDKDWIITGNENKISYTSLPPGNYTLLLNASNTNGKWSSHVLSIHIMIAPPFWKTWWFYLITTIGLCLLIYVFLNARIRSVKEAHARQMQFEREAMELHAVALRAQMNPHFIFNCLNSIKALIQEKQDKNAV
ncbi:MAG: triple tyrosine motif-containing protein [Puia sp.]